jgi:hypothetical protein
MELEDPKKAILIQAIEALTNASGLQVTMTDYQPYDSTEFHADAVMKIKVNNKDYKYAVKIKNIDRFAMIAQVKHGLKVFEHKPLLITPRLTEEATDKCKKLELNFIDLAGNAYINEPDLFLFIKGQKFKGNQSSLITPHKNKGAGTATNLRMVFTLLCKPEMLNAPYRQIEKVAGIALGTIGWIFYDLESRGFTIGGKQKTNRKLIRPEKLIQEWVTNYPIKLRSKLNPQKFRAPDQNWWKNIEITDYKAQWGGEVAADKLTNYLKPNFFTIYLQGKDTKKNMARLVIDNRLIPDPQGNIEILEEFWHFDDKITLPDQMQQETVPPLLIYADLVATNDPRNLETAKIIYKKYLENAYNQS